MNSARPPLDTWLLLLSAFALAMWCVVGYRGGGYYIQRDVFACQLSGYAALGYLALSLCAGPIIRGLTWFKIHISRETSARFSKNAGVTSALAAGLHTVIALTTYLKRDWLAVLYLPYLQWGGLAFVTLAILFVASFKPLTTLARWKLWKPLFRLSFVAAALALPHLLYAPFSPQAIVLGLYAAAIVVGCLRFIPERSAAQR